MPRGFRLSCAPCAGLSPRRRTVLAAVALPAPVLAQATSPDLPTGPIGWLLLGAGLCLLGTLLVLAWQQHRRGERAALRAERARSQRLLSLIDAWVWRTDAQHRLTLVRAPDGAPSGGGLSAAATGREFWSAFDGESAQTLRERLVSQAAFNDVEVLLPGADGGAPRWRLRALPCTDEDGRFAGHEGTAVPLAPACAAAEAAPPPAADAGSEAESFSYTVSHDLRAPIRVVEGFTKILKEDYGRVLDRIGNDHLDRILGAAARMNTMIDALLALARLSTQPLARQPVNLSQLASYVVEDLRRHAPERRVEVSIAPNLQATGDPTLLRVVLENLLGNAWKYTGTRQLARIEFGEVALDGRRAFRVSDNGAGFDMRYADRLFGVFQRLHSASEFAGTGVGLASVRRIVQRHGGDIWAEAEPDRGARFFFTLG
ncbi:sensor histidine kinase [Caldimonas sp. KR1-144]|uniref:sensor histidine kinase n=1 Tax=Caldimonas sp. KR1-144 TaxID=3400911 RepID=UPI003C0088F3